MYEYKYPAATQIRCHFSSILARGKSPIFKLIQNEQGEFKRNKSILNKSVNICTDLSNTNDGPTHLVRLFHLQYSISPLEFLTQDSWGGSKSHLSRLKENRAYRASGNAIHNFEILCTQHQLN